MAHIFGGAHFDCESWVDNWFADCLFVLDWYPLLIYGGTLATTYFDTDIFYLGVSCVTYLGVFLNWIFLQILDEYGPQGSSCFYDRQSPSHGSQLITEFVVMFLTLGLFRRYLPDTWTLTGSFVIVYAIYFERIYRNVDYVRQLYGGIALGMAVSIFGFTLLYRILTRFGDDIIQWRISRFFNIKNDYFGKGREVYLTTQERPKTLEKDPRGFQIKRTTRDQPLFEALATLKAQSPIRAITEPSRQHVSSLESAV